MPLNYDGRVELRIQYTTEVNSRLLSHRHTMDVSVNADTLLPGTEFSDILVTLKGGGDERLNTVVDAYLVLLSGLFHTSTAFFLAELWKYPEGSQDATFISAYALNVNGISTFATGAAIQLTLTFRSLGGGTMRCQLMEPAYSRGDKIPVTQAPAEVVTLSSYISGVGSPFLARDNTLPLAALNASFGQNEKLDRKRFRNA